MIVRVFRPPVLLAPYIEVVVYHEALMSDYDYERLLPDGTNYLVIDLRAEPKHVYDNDSLAVKQEVRGGWLNGQKKGYITYDAAKNSRMLVVQFKAGGTWPLFGCSAAELADQNVEMGALEGRGFELLREQLLELATPEAMAAHMYSLYSKRLIESKRAVHPVVARSLELLRQDASATRVGELQRDSGYSAKHFTRLFKEQVGISAKYLMRVMRFQQVLAKIEQEEMVEWADVAYTLGYYDQAHFINEFKHFSGVNPTAYLRERGPHRSYLPIMRQRQFFPIQA